MEHLESTRPPQSSLSSSHDQSSFLLRTKSIRSGITHNNNTTSLRSHYSTNTTSTARRSVEVGGSSLPHALPAGTSMSNNNNNSVLVDPPTTVHLTDHHDDVDYEDNENLHEGDNNNNNDNDNSNKLIGDSLLTMDDEYEDFTTEEGRNKICGGEYSSYEKRRKDEEKKIPSTRTGTKVTASASPPKTTPTANHFSFSPSRTDRYYSQNSIYSSGGSNSRPDPERKSGLVGDSYHVDKSSVHDNNNCLQSQRRRGRGCGRDDRRHRDVYQLVSSFKKELDKISAEADAAKMLREEERPSSSSRHRTTPHRYSGLNNVVTSTGKKYHSSMVTPTATSTAPATTGFNGFSNNGSVGTKKSFVSPQQGPEPYPTPPPPRPVETPSTIRPQQEQQQQQQQHYGGQTSTVGSEEQRSVHLSSRSTDTRKESTAKNTAAGPKYTPDTTFGAAYNRSYSKSRSSSCSRNFRDDRDIHPNIDQLKTTIQLQDKELNELRRENERLKMINNNYNYSKTPSSSSDKKKTNREPPSGSIHSYNSSSSSIKPPGQQTYSASSQKSTTTRNSAGRNRHFVDIDSTNPFENHLDTHFEEEEVHTGDYENYGTPLYHHNNNNNNYCDDQQNTPSLFSPGTRYIAKLARHMRLDDDHFVPLSEIIDRHWDKISAASTTNEN